MSAEYVLQNALNDAFDLLAANPDATSDFLGLLAEIDAEKYAEARDFFAHNGPSVILSYPTNPPPRDSAIVALVLGPESQAQSEQYIGSYLGAELEQTADGRPISVTERYGSLSRISFQIVVCAFNADLCVWIARAIRWALIGQRDILHTLGLAQHQIGVQDWQPDRNFGPDFVLRRCVSFSCTEMEPVSIGYGTFIEQINVAMGDVPTTYPQFVET